MNKDIKDNIYKIFQIIFIVLALLVQNLVSYFNISMYLILILLLLLYKNNKNEKTNKFYLLFSI